MLEKTFYHIKTTTITSKIFRIGLGILFMILGIVLAFYNSLFLIIAIFLCMLESVIILSVENYRKREKYNFETEVFESLMPNFNRIENSYDLTKAYKLFGYDKSISSKQICYNFNGIIDDTNVSFSIIKCKLTKNLFDNFCVKLYSFEFENINSVDLSKIKSSALRNYRYEIRGNKLYLATISKNAYAKVLLLNPCNYKNYEEFTKRILIEKSLLEDIVKKSGGKYNEESNN